MSPRNRKAGDRRLADMSAPIEDDAWRPELEPGPPTEETIYISEDVRFIQSLGFDELDRLAEWAVIQEVKRDGAWRTIAVYDNCHSKGVHRHLYNRYGNRFDEHPIRPVGSYEDVWQGLDAVLEWLELHWRENERRSDRGY